MVGSAERLNSDDTVTVDSNWIADLNGNGLTNDSTFTFTTHVGYGPGSSAACSF
jgi:hypothetical protein